MKPELKDKLFRDFPGVFVDNCTISSGDGWYDLCRIVGSDVQRYRENDADVVITNIRTKLGTMRVDIHGGGKLAWNTILFAMNMSEKTCEQCGEDGRIHNHEGVVLARCDTHIAEYVKEYDERMREYE